MKKILVIHGPNLDLLGMRETNVYGKMTLDEINRMLQEFAKENKVSLEIVQTNHEGEIVDTIGKAPAQGFEAVLINPAAYTHTSVAIRDAIAAINLPAVEIHLSNIYSREEFRQTSLISAVCRGQICGFGPYSYVLGLQAILESIKN
ncbi:MAG TPA: type II 3-dehydroquinate dehydratase [Candidatus Omnitrophota bacterium]|nr:type II 3-dehydroquinate dehydratase [Candidatus Omnitrophota bacterium]HQL40868.1 type II 3-dehydroquinate dehydratase [Candidatus Omnitrophota bacterium]